MSKSFHINTILAQAGIKSDKATGALVTPIHFSTTYQHPEFGQSTGFDYTRTKNPTRSKAEEVLAAIESAKYALATSSGMSAIVLAFSVFPVGSKVLAVRRPLRWLFPLVQSSGAGGTFPLYLCQHRRRANCRARKGCGCTLYRNTNQPFDVGI